MSCGTRTPVLWQRQPRLPLPVSRFLSARVHAALEDPADRALLAWPAVLGAPGIRAAHPEGLPEAILLEQAAPMLAGLSVEPREAWRACLERFPDTADRGPGGWVPHRIWDPLSALVSLRCGVTLLALLGLPTGERYGLAAGVSLFNAALFHECHDALEPLWTEAAGPLRSGLQGLILLAGGFHHMQVQNAPGMAGLWEDARGVLGAAGRALETPWGTVGFGPALDAAGDRLRAIDIGSGERGEEPPWERLWAMPRPEWELT